MSCDTDGWGANCKKHASPWARQEIKTTRSPIMKTAPVSNRAWATSPVYAGKCRKSANVSRIHASSHYFHVLNIPVLKNDGYSNSMLPLGKLWRRLHEGPAVRDRVTRRLREVHRRLCCKPGQCVVQARHSLGLRLVRS